MLKEAKDQTNEAQKLAAEDLASRIAAHEFERESLVEAGARVARGTQGQRGSLLGHGSNYCF